ncbi:DUF6596 domain-containing protein [Gordonia sp. PKS22-38]|uniref:DUF6596 domain-containing protein n=1 Tax=Gordonia prachuapensis TaxID=3115651 RepID=A0ABU7MNG8_9ACTN|nr:DUF6596 domain-containing protein [Gordonia sp. PKS22-38]
MTTRSASEVAERAARESYGRLLAAVAAATHDVAAAEDALGDAFERALRRWPVDGVPTEPDAWLLTVARNRQRDLWRSAAFRTAVPFDEFIHAGVAPDGVVSPLRDRRLELLLVCAHPAISAGVHAPLMLNTVLGYTAEQIGRAFAIPTSTMAARLVRAKRHIKERALEFVVPSGDEVGRRVAPVLESVWAAFSIEWPTVARERRALLLGLGQVISEVLRDDAEAHGLVAAMELSSARLPARTGDDGNFVPLSEQDPARWDADLIADAHVHLREAHRLRSIGRFQLEAAIGAVHCARLPGRPPDWDVLRRLHESLQALAAVVAETDGPEAALAKLESLDGAHRFQPAWVTRAHLLERLGRTSDAAQAYHKAISLTIDATERDYLTRRRTDLDTR